LLWASHSLIKEKEGKGRPTCNGKKWCIIGYRWELVLGQGDLLDLQKLHVEVEGGIGRDGPRMTPLTVRVVGRTDEVGPFADAHLGHPFVPSSNHLTLSNLELERLSSVSRRVKLLAIGQGPGVVDNDRLSLFGIVGSVTRFNNLDFDSHDL